MLIFVGKIVNTHGLKGELRILSNFKYKDRVFKVGMKVYIGNKGKCEVINSYRFHKIFDMITLKGYNDINQVLEFKGKKLYVLRDDLVLLDSEYLDEDLMGMNVYVGERYLGIVKNVERHSMNELLRVINKDKYYLVPYNFDIIKEINKKDAKIVVNDILGLFS